MENEDLILQIFISQKIILCLFSSLNHKFIVHICPANPHVGFTVVVSLHSKDCLQDIGRNIPQLLQVSASCQISWQTGDFGYKSILQVPLQGVSRHSVARQGVSSPRQESWIHLCNKVSVSRDTLSRQFVKSGDWIALLHASSCSLDLLQVFWYPGIFCASYLLPL